MEELASLTQLIELKLDNTRVTGSVEELASLTQLRYVFLRKTDVYGDATCLVVNTMRYYQSGYSFNGTSVSVGVCNRNICIENVCIDSQYEEPGDGQSESTVVVSHSIILLVPSKV
eukprot:COSAG02_NODE_6416_length_3586_cov_1.920562_1_plen_116_part_00